MRMAEECTMRTKLSWLTIVAGLTTVLAACGGSGTPSSGASTTPGSSTASGGTAASGEPAASGERYTIYLSAVTIGNDWLQQMLRSAQVAVDKGPLAGRVDLKVEQVDGSEQAQINSLNNIISAKPDAIIVHANSSTALNPTIKRACDAGKGSMKTRRDVIRNVKKVRVPTSILGGAFRFSTKTNDPLNAKFYIFQIQPNGTYKLVG